MCQLLGMNCNTPTDIGFSFTGFRKQGGLTDHHEDGFGIAFFEKSDCGKTGLRQFHDNKPSHTSPIADLINHYPIKAMVETAGEFALGKCVMKVKSITATFLLFFMSAHLPAFAMIRDCPAIDESNIRYISHSNYVEAKKDNKIIWHTELLENDRVKDPHLESDVQSNITCVKHTTEKNLVVSDRRGRRFILEKTTGKLLKSYRYVLSSMAYIESKQQPVEWDISHKIIQEFKDSNDYYHLTKSIDYVNHSTLTVYTNNTYNTSRYDIVIATSYNTHYLLENQNYQNIETIVDDFSADKPIDTKKWRLLTRQERKDWYDKKQKRGRQ